jgi:ribulose-phosphate 3-epimerase
MIQIIPSILVQSEEEFLEQIRTIKSVCSFVQIDIADGLFASGKTWIDPDAVKEKMTIDFELHMMVADPLKEIERWKDIDHMQRIIFHYSSVDNVVQTIGQLKTYGRDVCICLNPDVPVDVIDPIVSDIESVQFMSVWPGRQGQSFLPETLNRIAAVHKKYPNLPIADDGAVNKDTLPELVRAGATRFGPGSAVWKGNPVENYTNLLNIASETESETAPK